MEEGRMEVSREPSVDECLPLDIQDYLRVFSVCIPAFICTMVYLRVD